MRVLGEAMPGQDEEEAVVEIAASLRRRALELWGAERAKALGTMIEEMAQRIWLVSQAAPPAEVAPAFYLSYTAEGME